MIDYAYDRYRQSVDRIKDNITMVATVDNIVLLMKSAGATKFAEESFSCFTFKSGADDIEDGQFGFSEHLVNHLMQLAYDTGRKDVDETSFDIGYNMCRKDMLEALDVVEENDND